MKSKHLKSITVIHFHYGTHQNYQLERRQGFVDRLYKQAPQTKKESLGSTIPLSAKLPQKIRQKKDLPFIRQLRRFPLKAATKRVSCTFFQYLPASPSSRFFHQLLNLCVINWHNRSYSSPAILLIAIPIVYFLRPLEQGNCSTQ